MRNFLRISAISYFLSSCIFAIFSFSLTDPNLVLTTWGPYWRFQQFMWQTFFVNPVFLTECYVAILVLWFASYATLIWAMAKQKTQWAPRQMLLIGIILVLPIFFSYNALSHDVFNYLFNAKMIVVYHQNPHVHVALEFAGNTWTRFMHNTHTPAPYGYGWTAISLLPYLAGLGKFLPAWLAFRAWSVLGIGLTILAVWKIAVSRHGFRRGGSGMTTAAFAIAFLNPLFVIEMISSAHNDMWMMAPALGSFAIVLSLKKRWRSGLLISAGLLAFSISVKFATGLLLPFWLMIAAQQLDLARFLKLPVSLRKPYQPVVSWIKQFWPDLSVILLFLPLLTARSQQFNPWYLTWLLVWLPLLQWRWLKAAILVLSVSSLLRYVPWLWNGDFTDQIVLQQKMVTWIPLIFFLACAGIWSLWQKMSSRSQARR